MTAPQSAFARGAVTDLAPVDHDKVVAYGLDIELSSGREVITFRRDHTGQTMFGVHQSVESAYRRLNAVTPVELVWETG